MSQLLTIAEASKWAKKFLKRDVTTSNISYLIQYGKINKYREYGKTLVNRRELKEYYQSKLKHKQKSREENSKHNLNWNLSFSEYKESERTKHVNRLHPYKGKFIPQLVEYFLDGHTDALKRNVFFRRGDIVLDPFCGSGTTLVQANELGIHAIGIDISAFNTLISNVKIGKYNTVDIKKNIDHITHKLIEFQSNKKNMEFEEKLINKLQVFNKKYFPSPEFKKKVRKKQINENKYSRLKEKQFIEIYNNLVESYGIKIQQDSGKSFLDKWYLHPVREEIDFVFEQVRKTKNIMTKKIIAIILSRTIRSCRATTHSDLATLKKPITKPYYCKKHSKICKPIFSILSWWRRYSSDTLIRLQQFDKLRTNTEQVCLNNDSRTIDIFESLKKRNLKLARLLKKSKIRGIFSSPPYVGLIDYHEQHAYAYDLFGFKRRDELEIGPLYKGRGKEAQELYIQGISDVLNNCKKYLQNDYDVFLVANDKFRLYPKIAENAGMKIVNEFKRPVLNRVEKDRTAYSETIFHFKGK